MFKSNLLLLVVILSFYLLTSCSQKGMSNFLEISKSGESASSALNANSEDKNGNTVAQKSPSRPVVESSTDWKVVEKQLPKDAASGGVDWSAALRDGVISPRRAINGPGDPQNFVFNYDFYLPGPSPDLDAFFPHSAHTEWLQCANCHPKIFRTRGVKMTMADMYAGKYCGTCHGSVAFGLNACMRCHTQMGGAK